MARSMACELGPLGIRVNTLSPGHIYTKFVALLLPIYELLMMHI
jgi:NAD(P)-dependent dehydrogenase (short-subunit alcohol dehydrogenase family)